jgi:hypothetical protein
MDCAPRGTHAPLGPQAPQRCSALRVGTALLAPSCAFPVAQDYSVQHRQLLLPSALDPVELDTRAPLVALTPRLCSVLQALTAQVVPDPAHPVPLVCTGHLRRQRRPCAVDPVMPGGMGRPQAQ